MLPGNGRPANCQTRLVRQTKLFTSLYRSQLVSPGTWPHSDAGGLQHTAGPAGTEKPETRPWYPNITRPCPSCRASVYSIAVFRRIVVAAHSAQPSWVHSISFLQNVKERQEITRPNRIWSHSVGNRCTGGSGSWEVCRNSDIHCSACLSRFLPGFSLHPFVYPVCRQALACLAAGAPGLAPSCLPGLPGRLGNSTTPSYCRALSVRNRRIPRRDTREPLQTLQIPLASFCSRRLVASRPTLALFVSQQNQILCRTPRHERAPDRALLPLPHTHLASVCRHSRNENVPTPHKAQERDAYA